MVTVIAPSGAVGIDDPPPPQDDAAKLEATAAAAASMRMRVSLIPADTLPASKSHTRRNVVEVEATGTE